MSEELKAALARIACLEGEIAKRDEELAACRVAVENCDLFRARIADWARKAIEESQKGKKAVLVYPIDKWVLMLIAAGAEVRNLGDVRWCATEDGSQGKGTGRHIACFVLDGTKQPAAPVQQVSVPECYARLLKHAFGMTFGEDWNRGTAAETHRNKLIEAVFDCRHLLAAAPAAPAADAGLVEALDYQALFDAIAAATSVYANGAINISVQAFRESLAANSAKGVV